MPGLRKKINFFNLFVVMQPKLKGDKKKGGVPPAGKVSTKKPSLNV